MFLVGPREGAGFGWAALGWFLVGWSGPGGGSRFGFGFGLVSVGVWALFSGVCCGGFWVSGLFFCFWFRVWVFFGVFFFVCGEGCLARLGFVSFLVFRGFRVLGFL